MPARRQIAAEPSALDSFDLGEPLLRGVDHLPEAPQDVRVEDRPQRAAIARDLDLQLLGFVDRGQTMGAGVSSFR
jgi:hypothetical protein